MKCVQHAVRAESAARHPLAGAQDPSVNLGGSLQRPLCVGKIKDERQRRGSAARGARSNSAAPGVVPEGCMSSCSV